MNSCNRSRKTVDSYKLIALENKTIAISIKIVAIIFLKTCCDKKKLLQWLLTITTIPNAKQLMYYYSSCIWKDNRCNRGTYSNSFKNRYISRYNRPIVTRADKTIGKQLL